ncbi:MAG TPA: 3-phosphoshikimate 1-carboxyvinyltransferase, partial [Thermoanaerobaculia bacterium]|nr:3-phosphoshikimate 1-carboxyvinyltransferase [Thermoanaerobaculia bacterium]
MPIPEGGPLTRLADGAVRVAPGGTARGRVTPPPSKSLSHRAFNLALLAGEELTVERPLQAEDTHLFRTALAALGWTVEPRGDDVHLTPGERPPSAEILCGNAGTMYRFLVAALAALPGDWRLDGVPRLRER